MSLISARPLPVWSVAGFFKGQPQWQALNLNTAYHIKCELNIRRML
ncbi:hypothetical protein D1BOALGB6SA_8044 [Olavius sp. associated proteobacterium Delta 1]|nr:hypothetical protein D1BOALGB6SA_8044 [Olavius sp. associated proteobacterium Delta 1]